MIRKSSSRRFIQTLRERICPQISSPSPYAVLSRRYSRMASLLYSFPRAHETIGSCRGRCQKISTTLVMWLKKPTLDSAQKNHRAII